mgnify:CR=1 FL=1
MLRSASTIGRCRILTTRLSLRSDVGSRWGRKELSLLGIIIERSRGVGGCFFRKEGAYIRNCNFLFLTLELIHILPAPISLK